MDKDEQISLDLLLTPKVQMQRIVMAIVALSYAIYSYLNSDFYLFAKHGSGTHFHGLAANLLELMLVFAAVACMLPLIGLYDKRDVKPNYERLRRYSTMISYGLMACGIFLGVFHPTLLPDGAIDSWLIRGLGWLGLGLLFAQFGRLPPSYLVRKGNASSNVGAKPMNVGVAYFGAFLVALMALLLYAFAIFLMWRRPDLIMPISKESLFIWIPLMMGMTMTFWTYSIIRRSKPIAN